MLASLSFLTVLLASSPEDASMQAFDQQCSAILAELETATTPRTSALFRTGTAVHRDLQKNFPLDAATMVDLEIDKVVIPKLASSIQTSFGMRQLAWSLKNQNLDADEIRARQ